MNRWRLALVCIAGVVILLRFGYSRTKSPDRVIQVSEHDPKMNAAIEKARASVDTFIAALKAPKPGQTGFNVKKKFEDGRQVEHIWLDQVTYDGTNFEGIIANDPEMAKNVKVGQKATVAPAEVSDWMYIDHGKLVGGETVRVLLEGLSPAERDKFKKSVDFSVE
jgi:uncharacterized protein YegJ (DUF2314 family)